MYCGIEGVYIYTYIRTLPMIWRDSDDVAPVSSKPWLSSWPAVNELVVYTFDRHRKGGRAKWLLLPSVVLGCSYEHLKPALITCYHMIPPGTLGMGVGSCKDYGKSGNIYVWCWPLMYHDPLIHVLRPYTVFGRINTVHHSIQESKS